MLFVAEYQYWFFVLSFIWQKGSPVKGVFCIKKVGTFLCHMQVEAPDKTITRSM
jgi:hypothetical protein